jgi:hypothetical protein
MPTPSPICRLVLYNGHGNVPAAYAIATESVTVKTGKTKPVSFTEVSPTKWTTGQLSYGPYEKSAPYTKVCLFVFVINLFLMNFFNRNQSLSTLKTTRPSLSLRFVCSEFLV